MEPTHLDAFRESPEAKQARLAREIHRLRCMAVLVNRDAYWPEQQVTYRVPKSRDERVVVTFSFLERDWEWANDVVTRLEADMPDGAR